MSSFFKCSIILVPCAWLGFVSTARRGNQQPAKAAQQPAQPTPPHRAPSLQDTPLGIRGQVLAFLEDAMSLLEETVLTGQVIPQNKEVFFPRQSPLTQLYTVITQAFQAAKRSHLNICFQILGDHIRQDSSLNEMLKKKDIQKTAEPSAQELVIQAYLTLMTTLVELSAPDTTP